MGKLVSREVSRSFRSHDVLLSGLGADALAALTTGNSDVAVMLSEDGVVIDVAYRDPAISAWDLEDWIGRPWRDTVTVESREKIDGLLTESMNSSPTRSRQVNHPANTGPGGKPGADLPVGYRIVSFPGSPYRLGFGTDLRAMAEMQQRLVMAQIEMEKDYRKLRDIESRYRILFHLAVEPLIVAEAQTLKILDANEGAAKLLAKPVDKLVGSSAATIFAKADQLVATETLRAIEARARADAFRARPATLEQPMTVQVTPFREFGRTNLLVRLTNDDLSQAVRPPVPDNHMMSIVESLPEGIVVVDGDGRIIEANPAFLDLIRVVTQDRVRDRGLDNWLGGSSVDVQVLMANLREHGTMRRFSSVVRDDLGGTQPVEVSAARISSRDGPIFGFAIREAPRAEAISGSRSSGSNSQLTDLVGRVPLKDLVRDSSDVIEKLCIEAALRLTDNNRASAADMLGLSRQSLYIKLKRYGIVSESEGAEK